MISYKNISLYVILLCLGLASLYGISNKSKYIIVTFLYNLKLNFAN